MKNGIFKIFNRGFTLIELLAVIVVLSVILVIAIPKIGNVMDETRKRSLQQSAESLLRKAKEVSMMQNEEEIVYTIENGAFSGEVLKISGTLPDAGNIKINEDGTTEVAVHDDKFCALKSKIDDNVYVIDYDGYECRVTTPKSCFTYTKTSTQVTITDYDNSCEKDVSIPNKIEGLPVTSIGDEAFYLNQLTSVDIPSSVTSIGAYAFSWNQLTSIVIPSSVTSIGYYAFNNNQLPDNQAFIYKRNSDGSEDKTTIVSYGGAKRDNVSIPNSVTSIGDYAFFNNQLISVSIPSSVTSIGYYAFSLNQLTSVVIPSSVTSIGGYAFYDSQLTSVVIPSSVTSIGYGAFSNNQLTSLTIPSSVTSIGNVAFYDNQLTSVVIPSSVTSIGYAAFSVNQLTSVVIPSSVTSIVDSAFNHNLLTNIEIPSSVTSIGSFAFTDNKLTSVVIPSSVTLSDYSISPSFYTSYVTNNNKLGGTYTSTSQYGIWTKQP